MFLSQTYHIFVTKYGCKNTQIFFYDNSLSINRSTFEALLATTRKGRCFHPTVGYYASNPFNYSLLHLFLLNFSRNNCWAFMTEMIV